MELDKLYNNSKTYVDFFYSIRDKINNKTELCTLFGLFLFKFMYDISNGATMRFLGDYWIFPTENIVKIDFTEDKKQDLEKIKNNIRTLINDEINICKNLFKI